MIQIQPLLAKRGRWSLFLGLGIARKAFIGFSEIASLRVYKYFSLTVNLSVYIQCSQSRVILGSWEAKDLLGELLR